PLSGHPLALFARLRLMAHAPHAALVHAGDGRWWLSLSPELFFTLHDGRLVARPMKGTAPREADAQSDAAAAASLSTDPKNRAENLMIADLIRNDLSRVSMPGSVRTPKLLAVETYPSLHQMTSTITSERMAGKDALDVLAALFPCGSITGAPKIRAMEILAELESHPRGIYCGSIGWIGPDGDAADFNVAIRTIAIEAGQARIGLGSGIVADSAASEEWRECLLKAEFLHPARPATLIETMRREADGSVPLLRLHLARMARSAARFGFPFAPDELAARITALPPAGAQRLRLLLAESGALALQLSALPSTVSQLLAMLAPLPVPATDWRLRHKSNNRNFLDVARQATGAAEVLFLDGEGFATQGSFTNIFVASDGIYHTPPLSRGLLPGVLRESLLTTGAAIEADLHESDLRMAAASGRLFVGNALRGLIPVALAASRAEA
ncbi:MAG: bifunctional anthranilate synthase component I family protein/class IV aminotransferase, partial [Sphingomonadaceae bacterium]